jgi:hypothetical protein
MTRKYYLSYGSNLHISSMRRRCPDAKPLSKMLINNARLVFRGVADLSFERGHLAPLGLWEISAKDEAVLDSYEGVNSGMYSKYDIKVDDVGNTALIYLMNDDGIFPPSAQYAAIIRAGYCDFGLDEAFLDDAICHSYRAVSHSAQTRARRKRQKLSNTHRYLAELPKELKNAAWKAEGEGIK